MPTSAEASSGIEHSFPLLEPSRVDLPIIANEQRTITGRSFLGAVARFAASLPRRRYAVNLCGARSRFLLGFAAALSRGQTTVLPPSRADMALRRVLDEYPDSYLLVDDPLTLAGCESVRVPAVAPTRSAAPNPWIPASQLAAIVFTSGSTGEAQPILKTWDTFCRSAELIADHLGLPGTGPHHILATVPAQHMYGLETTILLPLRSGQAVTDFPTFYPADIQRALALLPSKRMLVTTPLHLRACVEDGGRMPPVELIVSATAPLSQALAKRAEILFQGRLVEIFGFSEAGSVAVRRTAQTDRWDLFRGLAMRPLDDRHVLSGPYLPRPVEVQDRIELLDDRHFRLLGRFAEQVNVAGKRTSLAALDTAINDIEGVRDGAFFVPERPEAGHGVPRLIAFAVAPGLGAQALAKELSKRIDPAFMPRPLHLVDALPRRENGKLAREDLLALAEACSRPKQ